MKKKQHEKLNDSIKDFIHDVERHEKKGNLTKKDLEAQYNKLELEDRIREENLVRLAYKLSRAKFKILVVDDDKQVQCMNKVFLTEDCNLTNITIANDGKEALKLCKKQEFDLILSDYRMPKMDGRELKLALDDINYEAIFILISGYVAPEMKHLKDLGILMIPKPFSRHTFTKVVESAYLLKLTKKLEELEL